MTNRAHDQPSHASVHVVPSRPDIRLKPSEKMWHDQQL